MVTQSHDLRRGKETINIPQGQADLFALRVPAYAARADISPRHIYRLIEEGVIPVIRLGRRCVLIPVEQADAALMAFATGGES